MTLAQCHSIGAPQGGLIYAIIHADSSHQCRGRPPWVRSPPEPLYVVRLRPSLIMMIGSVLRIIQTNIVSVKYKFIKVV